MPYIKNNKKLQWLRLNLVLLGCYLGFFHMALLVDYPMSLAIGVCIAAFVVYLVVRFRSLCINRFEFLLYLVVPLDIVLEGLIPFHESYSFYFCAIALWLVFGLYRAGHRRLETQPSRIEDHVSENQTS